MPDVRRARPLAFIVSIWHNMAKPVRVKVKGKGKRPPRNVMIRALVTKELAEKLEALAAKEQRSLSAMIAILVQRAVDKES
jgi:CopG-like RHH_1 or ribbon-helix-helix domain, RHH_5